MVEVSSPGGRRIAVREWPVDQPRAIVQILHGLAEHIDRYDRFAAACNERGYSVFGHNHRGHGAQSGDGQLGHFADRDGWSLVVDDAHAVFRHIAENHAGVPIVLLGHSMGSYIAQSFVMREAPEIAALVLSGSTSPNRGEVRFASLLATVVGAIRGKRRLSKLFDTMVFKNYNKAFAPARTPFDWLSRDAAEVERYVDDPLCGGLSSYALWKDIFGGLLEISTPAMLSRVRADLPLLITGGDVDPVGGRAALTRLAAAYEAAGHKRVTLKLYADGRHEMLNESNRDEVTDDWLSWIEAALRER